MRFAWSVITALFEAYGPSRREREAYLALVEEQYKADRQALDEARGEGVAA